MKRKLLMGVVVLGLIACGDKNKDANQVSKNTPLKSTAQASVSVPNEVKNSKASAFFSDYPEKHCTLKKEQLSDPDRALKLWLEGKRCNSYVVAPDEYSSLIAGGNVHPTNKLNQLEREYGRLRLWPDQMISQSYKEFKVIDKKEIAPTAGLQTFEYTVELLYPVILYYYHVPENVDGMLPACERNKVTIYAINTPGGWLIDSKGFIGHNLYSGIADFRDSYWYKGNSELEERHLQAELKIAAQCTDKLN